VNFKDFYLDDSCEKSKFKDAVKKIFKIKYPFADKNKFENKENYLNWEIEKEMFLVLKGKYIEDYLDKLKFYKKTPSYKKFKEFKYNIENYIDDKQYYLLIKRDY
jgi:hypothetical protein